MKKIFFAVSFLFGFFVFSKDVFAEDFKDGNYLKGRVEKVNSEEISLKVKMLEGDLKNKEIDIFQGYGFSTSDEISKYYKKGDLVLVGKSESPDGSFYYVGDFYRLDALWGILIVFALIAIIVGGRHGVGALVGLSLSFFLLMQIFLPSIENKKDPIFFAIIISLIILTANFYLTSGINKKTNIAILSSFIGLFVTILISIFFIDFAKLSGQGSEEDIIIVSLGLEFLNFKSLLVASFLIGVVGVIDDVIISQISTIFELKKMNPKVSFSHLFLSGMNVGKDHAGSMINTLVMAYTSTSIPLLIILRNQPMFNQNFLYGINSEIIFTEVSRIIVESIGVLLILPISTLLATLFVLKEKEN